MSSCATSHRAASADAIVVLGCRVHEHGVPSAAALRRARRAALAWHDSQTGIVIASGGRRWRGTSEADALFEALLKLGVPERVIVRELWSLSTVENAWYSTELLRAAGLERPLIVTCDWHMPRALACFEHAGIAGVALAVTTEAPGVVARAARSALEGVRRWVDRRGTALWFEP